LERTREGSSSFRREGSSLFEESCFVEYLSPYNADILGGFNGQGNPVSEDTSYSDSDIPINDERLLSFTTEDEHLRFLL
jgi:hypothetical protein